MTATDDDILLLLKMRGPLATAEAAAALAITPQGMRQRFEALGEAGFVAGEAQRAGVGRPRMRWSLTAAGEARFPDRHDRLAVELIEGIRKTLGEKALDRLIATREAEQRRRYRAALEAATDLEDRLERLAAERTREGYMAEVRKEEDGCFVLIEHHCPICAAATACQGFCRSELRLFREALGADVEVERVQHLLAGERRCAYRVAPRRQAPRDAVAKNAATGRRRSRL